MRGAPSIVGLTLAVLATAGNLPAQTAPPNHVRWVMRAGERPYLHARYGMDRLAQRQFGGTFADIGSLQLALGYGELRPYRTELLALDERAVYVAYGDQALGFKQVDSTRVVPTVWQLGLAFKGAYGYPVGADLAILPAFGASFDITKITTQRPYGLSGADSTILDRYEGSFRFGHSAEAELRFELSRSVSLSGLYQLSIIYPRVVFWQWVGSFGLAAVGMGVLSQMTVEIIRSSPALGPVLGWLLKSAFAYGIYALWRDNMHWPFKSETPLTQQSAAISVSIVF